MYFFMALLQDFQAELLKIQSPQEMEEVMLSLPWRVQSERIPRLLEYAVAIEKITPISANHALLAVYSQSASELLPDFLTGDATLWDQRLTMFFQTMEVKNDSPLQNGLIRFAGLENQLETYVLKEYGIARVLSRESVFIPYASLADCQGMCIVAENDGWNE